MRHLSWFSRRCLEERSLCSSCFSHYLSQRGRLFFTRPSTVSRRYAFSTNSCTKATPVRKDEHGIEDEEQEPSQAYPLSGYYYDILSAPSPQQPAVSSRRVAQPPPENLTPASTTQPQSPEDRMAIVFGSRLAGPGSRSTRYNPATMPPESTWKTVKGVPIPPRPMEPDNCCMSGCAHCVWDDFRDDMEAWAARLQEAYAKSKSSHPEKDMRQAPRMEVDSASISMDDDGGGSETNWSLPVGTKEEDLFAGIPVGIREFMKTEKRLRDKHLMEKATA